MVAISIPSFRESGSFGLSEDLPLIIWKSPSGVTKHLSTLGRYQSKSQRKLLFNFGISKTVALGVPDTLNTLDLKSNVEQFTNAGDATVPVPLNKFFAPGLKSR